MMRNRNKLLFLITVVLLLLSGCNTGKREINDLGLVMAVGIDKPDKKQFEVTVQLARPADARGQTGAPAGNTGDPIWSASSKGATLFEAIRNLGTISSRRIFWAHNFVIVINEEVARNGIKDIIDFFTRNPELRMRTWVVSTPDKAKDVVSQLTGLEVIPGEAMDKLFRYSNVTSVAPQSQMLDIQAAYLSESTHPYMARVHLKSRGVSNQKAGQQGAYKQVQLAGTAVFKDDKLVGTLSQKETEGFLPFVEPIQSNIIVVDCSDNQSAQISLEIKNIDFDITPTFTDSKPAFKIDSNIEAHLVEADCPISLDNVKQINEIEASLEDVFRKKIETVLDKAQKDFKSDFLELGKVFHNKYPAEWKEIKGDWESLFPTVKTNVIVQAKITSDNLLFEPTQSGKE